MTKKTDDDPEKVLPKILDKVLAHKAGPVAEVLPLATHGATDRPIHIGTVEIPCFVLEDETRVLTQRGLLRALGVDRGNTKEQSGAGARLASIMGAENIKSAAGKDLTPVLNNPIRFKHPVSRNTAYGYEATVLADICDAMLAARRNNAFEGDARLNARLHAIAAQCEILLSGFARVGIIALVDEATGYQEVRDKRALREILDRFIRPEMAAWAKRFPDEFYQEIFRLRGWVWKGMHVNRPHAVAHWTNDIVYERLAPGVLAEMKKRDPPDANGQRKGKLRQWLTDEIGYPALAQHIHALMALQRSAGDGDWAGFYRSVQRAFPKVGENQLIRFDNDPD